MSYPRVRFLTVAFGYILALLLINLSWLYFFIWMCPFDSIVSLDAELDNQAVDLAQQGNLLLLVP